MVADRVPAIARPDPTVAGVVGMGRDTGASQAAIRRLDDAGLAIVDTAGSSDHGPTATRRSRGCRPARDRASPGRVSGRSRVGCREYGEPITWVTL